MDTILVPLAINVATGAFFAWRAHRKDDYGGWMWWGGYIFASAWTALGVWLGWAHL